MSDDIWEVTMIRWRNAWERAGRAEWHASRGRYRETVHPALDMHAEHLQELDRRATVTSNFINIEGAR